MALTAPRDVLDPGPARLEYRLAFDVASAWLARAADARPPVLVASATVFVREALTRLAGPVVVVPDSTPVADAVRARALSERTGIDDAVDVWTAGPGPDRPRPVAVLWAAPQPATWRQRLAKLDAELAQGGLLAMLAAGERARLFSSLRKGWSDGEPTWAAGSVQRQLAQRGYRLEAAYSFGGIESLACAVLSRLAGRLGHPALADRFEARYRTTLTDLVDRRTALLRLLIMRKEIAA